MNIYFSANARSIESKIDIYRVIVAAIRESEHAVVNNWTEAAAYRGHTKLEKVKWQEICREARTGIESANVVIAEVSGVSAFGVGYEVGVALSLSKPVLALVQKDKLNESYVQGLMHPLVTVGVYDNGDVTKIVKAFVSVGE